MGIFEKVFSRPIKAVGNVGQRWEMFTVSDGHFSSWNKDLYESELARSAIHARAVAVSKLELDVTGSAKAHTINSIKHRPNDYCTWSQFLYRVSTILDNTNTCFIVPTFDVYGEINGLYPVIPATCKVVRSDKSNEPWLQYEFATGRKRTVELKKVAVLTKFQYKNEFFGAGNDALTSILELIHLNKESIKDSISSGSTFRFMAQLKHQVKDEDLEKEQARFNTSLFRKGKGGMLLIPSLYDNVKQIDYKRYNIDDAQEEHIRTNIYNYFGVNEDILQNKANAEQQASFYDTVVAPFAIQLSETLSALIYSERELSAGNRIRFENNRLQFMSDSQKISFVQMALDRGFMEIDECRAVLGLPPLPDGTGARCIARGEYKTVGAAAAATLANVAATNEEDVSSQTNVVDVEKLQEINEDRLEGEKSDKLEDEAKKNANIR